MKILTALLLLVSTAATAQSSQAGSSWISVSQNGLSSSVALAVAIAITQKQKGVLSAWIPPNALVRIRSVITGTAAVNLLQQQEAVF